MLPPKEQTVIEKGFFKKIWTNPIGRPIVIILLITSSVILLLSLLSFIFADPFLNGTVKNSLISAVESIPNVRVKIGKISYHPLENGITIDSIRLVRMGQDSTREMHILGRRGEIYGINWFNMIIGRGLQLDEIKIQNPIIQINESKSHTNTGDAPPDKRNENKNNKSGRPSDSPASGKLLPLTINRIEIRNGKLVRKELQEKSVFTTDSIRSFSISVYKIRINPGQKLSLRNAEDIRISLSNIFHRIKESKYEIKLGSLTATAKYSSISADKLEFRPYVSDSTFFRGKQYVSTRFRTSINKIRITGINFAKIAGEGTLLIKKIFVNGFIENILTDRRLPEGPADPNPKDPGPDDSNSMMPGGLIAQIKSKFTIDSILCRRGTVRLEELYSYSKEPAVLPFTKVNVVIGSISNSDSSKNKMTQIDASGYLAGAGKLSVVMNMNLLSEEPSFTYKGKLGPMDMTKVNSYLKLSAGVILNSCKVKQVTFDVDVKNGHARGSVVPIYGDLKVEILKKEEKKTNILTKVLSLFARKAKLHESNPQRGKLITGKVDYKRNDDEPLFQFIWNSLREALGDAVGF